MCAWGLLRKKGFVTCTKRGQATGVPCVGVSEVAAVHHLGTLGQRVHEIIGPVLSGWCEEQPPSLTIIVRLALVLLLGCWCRRRFRVSSVDLLGEGPPQQQGGVRVLLESIVAVIIPMSREPAPNPSVTRQSQINVAVRYSALNFI